MRFLFPMILFLGLILTGCDPNADVVAQNKIQFEEAHTILSIVQESPEVKSKLGEFKKVIWLNEEDGDADIYFSNGIMNIFEGDLQNVKTFTDGKAINIRLDK